MSAEAVAGPREAKVANPVFDFLLRLADDRLVLGHRLSEWCGHGPILEEDIALSNIALDLVGQASAVLKIAGDVEGAGRNEDALAFFRTETDYRNAQLVELPNGDFGFTVVRQFLFDAFSVLQWEALRECRQPQLAGIAAKALKEDSYHLRHSSDWVLRLGDGTADSHSRAQRALNDLWRFTGELFEHDAVDEVAEVEGLRVDHAALHVRWRQMVVDVISRATLSIPTDAAMATGGRRGRHSEFLGHLLAEMQSVARSHPGASW